jgi:hypothetical protein
MIRSAGSLVEGIGVTKPEMFPRHPVWFTDIAFSDMFVLPREKQPVKDLLSITAAPEVRSSYIIKTPESVSFEGFMLEGCNLILEMLFKYNVKYVADTESQNIHLAYFESNIRKMVIVMPTHHIQVTTEKYFEICQLHEDGKIILKPYVESIYGVKQNCRTIYVSIAMFVDASIKHF